METVVAHEAPLSAAEIGKLRWRCRRGLLENDLLIERFFAAHGGAITRPMAHAIEALMELADNDLLDLLLRRREPEGPLALPQVRRVLELMRRPPRP
ncbi:MAG TPA: succinate dehydrogenase assembly factor 2 [Methylibium sp.]|uniref:FAD assembly factor SdhE n=1 Tax=Methylibium sp. TaxID=2067992 RepID=UPI002DBBB957|nr:succinate dehydrogenase assembly factor 2 [Methylibium sp.]HEU4457833.1 succinate dehydrogenase assembly factor 2 [Methylibium sp.]